jgi:radical SAM superfamily enzyme YgiQ (UPF0313 family)
VGLPLGCLYVAAALKDAGQEVSIFDCQVYTDQFPSWTWGDGEMFGAPWPRLEREISKFSPDLVGISNQFTVQFDNAIKVAEIVKGINSDIITVVGGNHASVLPMDFFEASSCIDIVCMDEGEHKLQDIIRCIEEEETLENIKGIVFREDGEVIANERGPYLSAQELDELSFPAYQLVDMERYFRLQKAGYHDRARYGYPGSHRAVPMITSRGCPFDCTFCSIALHMGKRFRAHSVTNVLEHIALLTNLYGVRHISFEDDNLTLDRSRFEELLDGMLERQFNITWDAPNGVRADLLSRGLIQKSKEAGCTHLTIGVESGKQSTLDRIVKKKLDLKDVQETARICRNLALDLEAFFIIGFPAETIADMQATLDYAIGLEEKYDVSPIVQVLKPLIGTEVYKEALKDGCLVSDVTAQTMPSSITGGGLIETENFTRADIIRLAKGFSRRHRQLRIKRIVKFMLKHPEAIARLISDLGHSSDRRRTLGNDLYYLNCLLRNFEDQNADRPDGA